MIGNNFLITAITDKCANKIHHNPPQQPQRENLEQFEEFCF